MKSVKKPSTKKPSAAPDSSWSALARELGVSRQSVVRWRSRPDAPTSPDVDSWRAYVDEQSLGAASGAEIADLKAELLREQIEHARRKNQVQARELIPLEEAVAAAQKATLSWSLALRRVFIDEGPTRLAGLPLPELRAVLQSMSDEAIDAHREEILRYAKKLNEPPTDD